MRKSDRNSATLIAYFCNKNIIANVSMEQKTALSSNVKSASPKEIGIKTKAETKPKNQFENNCLKQQVNLRYYCVCISMSRAVPWPLNIKIFLYMQVDYLNWT